jgi:nucleotide-binding universal stress UspA family protein
MSTVIVGIDSSPTAAEAAQSAARLAGALGLSLTLVIAHANKRPVHVDGPGGDSWDLSSGDEARNTANNVAGTLRDLVSEINVVEASGKPADVLVEQAKELDASVIVVGNKRVQGPSRVLGAIATAVAQRAPCDVYIAKTT